jgi:hydroxymethylbilane synthase
LGGSCDVPLAAHAAWCDGELELAGRVSMPDGSRIAFAQAATRVATVAEARALGGELARALEAQGAREIVTALAAGDRGEPGA